MLIGIALWKQKQCCCCSFNGKRFSLSVVGKPTDHDTRTETGCSQSIHSQRSQSVRSSLSSERDEKIDRFRLSLEQFFENEDVTHLYILHQSSSLLATNVIPADFNSFERVLLFLKSQSSSKLTRENLGESLSLSLRMFFQ